MRQKWVIIDAMVANLPCHLQLSSLAIIRDGMNLCIFGAPDSGKTYLARALGAEACREYRVAYYHCEELVSEQVVVRKIDYKKYQKKVKAIAKLELVILHDFLLHPITEDDEVKALYDVLKKRNELSRSWIICSQREPMAWLSMLMEDEVSFNSLLKRVTKYYIVMIKLLFVIVAECPLTNAPVFARRRKMQYAYVGQYNALKRFSDQLVEHEDEFDGLKVKDKD